MKFVWEKSYLLWVDLTKKAIVLIAFFFFCSFSFWQSPPILEMHGRNLYLVANSCRSVAAIFITAWIASSAPDRFG